MVKFSKENHRIIWNFFYEIKQMLMCEWLLMNYQQMRHRVYKFGE